MTRRLAAVLSLALVAATLEPLLRDPVDDDFPLSTYPMFAEPRDPQQTFSYAYGLTASGERRDLSPDAIGSREPMQAFATLQAAVAEGSRPAAALCHAIAERVGGGDIVAIRIVSATHDAVAYFTTGARGHERERARCEVP